MVSVSEAQIHLLSSRLLSLDIAGGCGGWIALVLYVEIFSRSLTVFYLFCGLPILLSGIMKARISEVPAEVESCSRVSVDTWYLNDSICFLILCCTTLGSVGVLLMLRMLRALIISQTFLHIIFFFLMLEIWQILGHFILKLSKCL